MLKNIEILRVRVGNRKLLRKRKEMMQNTNILLLPESSNIGHKAEV